RHALGHGVSHGAPRRGASPARPGQSDAEPRPAGCRAGRFDSGGSSGPPEGAAHRRGGAQEDRSTRTLEMRWSMPKKRPTRPPLRVVPPPSPAPLTFGDQVAQAMELYKAQKEPYKLLNLVCDLAVYPATTSIQTADPLIRYFALAAWYWQAEA